MTSPPVGVERRVGQRFEFNLPVSLRNVATSIEGLGFTQDLSSRGAFLVTDMIFAEGEEIELTLKMPSEITLGESMHVRCRGLVLRIVNPTERSASSVNHANKIGVAVCLKGYEYLPEAPDSTADFRRISALHPPLETETPATSTPASPRIAVN
jgi:PilZ domain